MARPFLPLHEGFEVPEEVPEEEAFEVVPEDELGYGESSALVEVPPPKSNEERLRELITILSLVGGSVTSRYRRLD